MSSSRRLLLFEAMRGMSVTRELISRCVDEKWVDGRVLDT